MVRIPLCVITSGAEGRSGVLIRSFHAGRASFVAPELRLTAELQRTQSLCLNILSSEFAVGIACVHAPHGRRILRRNQATIQRSA